MTKKRRGNIPRLFVRMPRQLKIEFDAGCRVLSEQDIDLSVLVDGILVKCLSASAQPMRDLRREGQKKPFGTGKPWPKFTMSDIVICVAEKVAELAKMADSNSFSRHLTEVLAEKASQPTAIAPQPGVKVIHASQLPEDYTDEITIVTEIPSLFA